MAELKSPAKTESCPTDEELSAWFDGEGQLTPEQIRHVKAPCPHCTEKLESFQSMTSSFQKVCTDIDEEQIRQRILTNTRSMIINQIDMEKPKRKLTLPWLIRIIAFLIAAALFIWLMFFKDKNNAAPAGVRGEKDVYHYQILSVPVPKNAEFRNPSASYQVYSTGAAHTVSRHPLEFINPPSVCVFDARNTYHISSSVFICSKVEQNWYSPSFSAETLKGHVKSVFSEIRIAAYSIRENGNSLLISAEMNIRQLPVFVKQLNAWGLHLIRPAAAPLPEQNFFYGMGYEKCQCRFTILTQPSDFSDLPVH